MNAIILDTETTDKEQGAEVIELAWSQWEPGGAPQEMFIERFKPRLPPKFGALATHHILMEELEECRPSSEAPTHVMKYQYWIGHNVDFDWKMLGCPPVKRICTLALARSLWPECDSHNLGALMYFTQGATPEVRDMLRGAHSAGSDVEMCGLLLETILKVISVDTIEELWAESEDARVPRTMTFGKFKGQPISAVDRGYANWYRKQADIDPYVVEAFRREGLV